MKCDICDTQIAEVNKSLSCKDCFEEIVEAMHRHEAKVDELKSLIKLILEADALREHAYDTGSIFNASIYDLCKHLTKE